MDMARIAVTELQYDKAKGVFAAAGSEGLECLRAPTEESALAGMIRAEGIRYAVLGVEPYAGPLYEALPEGGVIARFGVGHDGVNKPLATSHGLLCTNTPGVLDDSVAEFTIGLILASARHIAAVAASARGGKWTPKIGGELKGRTLAIIGCGPIGRRVARIAAMGFGMNVVGCEIADVDATQMQREFGFARIVKDYGEAVAGSDFVSLHIPSVPATKHFMNRDRLGLLPAKAWLINTARGAVVDEVALFEALAEKRIAGAALDVFEQEPYVPAASGKDLRMLDNVIMTPHVGSSTQEACDRMAERVLHNIRLAEAGRYTEMDLLNPDVLPRLAGGRA